MPFRTADRPNPPPETGPCYKQSPHTYCMKLTAMQTAKIIYRTALVVALAAGAVAAVSGALLTLSQLVLGPASPWHVVMSVAVAGAGVMVIVVTALEIRRILRHRRRGRPGASAGRG